jgi:hypothetical protein
MLPRSLQRTNGHGFVIDSVQVLSGTLRNTRLGAMPSSGLTTDAYFHVLIVLGERAGSSDLRAAVLLHHAAVFVTVSMGHPVPQARFTDAEILGDLNDRFDALVGQFDCALPELHGVWCGRADILPGDRSYLWSGVRTTEPSSGDLFAALGIL